MDLGIPQKSLRVRLKEEKEGKGHSFFHEQIERRRAREQGRFLGSEEKEAAAWHTFQGSISARHFSKTSAANLVNSRLIFCTVS